MTRHYDTIYEYLLQIPVIDTHEHLWDEEYRVQNPGDWTTLFYHYSETVLKSAGMTDSESGILYSPDSTHTDKWSIFSRYYPLVANTAYIKIAQIAIRDLYDIKSITADSMEELSKRMKSAIKPGFHRWVLREKAGIDYCAVNCFDRDQQDNRYPMRNWGDTQLLKPDLFVDGFLYPTGKVLIERETGIDASTLDGWISAMDWYFNKYADQCCAVKIALAYSGPLDFHDGVSGQDAERLYIRHLGSPLNYIEARPLVDYLFFQMLKRAADYHIPLKFHTGIYSGGPDIDPIRRNVADLVCLACSHPELYFIAMHIAYPFQNELILATKQLRNLYADMCWSWAVDPEASAIFLKQALCTVPINKIMGFGGDYAFVENTYGHLMLARKGISRVLADLMDSDYLTLDEACNVGRFLLRESAERVYNNNS